MNDIQIFNNPQFGDIRIIADENDELWFNANDICKALGYSNPRDAVAKHVGEDDVAKRDAWVETGMKADGSPATRKTEMTYVNESGLYSLIFGSKLDTAKIFKKWVTSEVLPSIRKTGSYEINPTMPFNAMLHQAEVQVFLIEQISHNLRLNDVSRLGMYQGLAEQHGLSIPAYVKSKGVVKSAKDLLLEKNLRVSAIRFNTWLSANGYIEQKTRPTTGGKVKKFWSITEKGESYGENNINPHNPKETQPLWYEDKFEELFNLVKP